jgi:predicted O-linked N-acetylglucosamine transferase (SPINDLY family)
VDLAGHTGFNRLAVFAHKPAPVQITYLGYPDTTGLSRIDVRITDEQADPDPEVDQSFHTERLVRLARPMWAYRPADHSPEPGDPPAGRGGVVTFGSLNALAKINANTIALWASVMAQVPASRIILKAAALSEESVRVRLSGAFAGYGIAADRLDLRPRTASVQEHLRTYHEIDLALDTYPYHGTTTTCDALWMGVPVVSLAGDAHVSRVGASLLGAVGLDELVAHNQQEFIDIAVRLAQDRQRLTPLRAELRPRLQASPLMDAASLARALEAVYRSEWQRFCAARRA